MNIAIHNIDSITVSGTSVSAELTLHCSDGSTVEVTMFPSDTRGTHTDDGATLATLGMLMDGVEEYLEGGGDD